MKNNRVEHLYQLLKSADLTAVVLTPGSTLTYLTGMHFHIMERPTLLFLAPPAEPVMVLPELEMAKLQHSAIPVKSYSYNDNPATWGAAFKNACQYLALDGKTIGMDPYQLRALELQFLQDAAPHAHFVSAESALSSLRIRKDPEEISAMKRAVQIAQDGFQAMVKQVKIGMTEREIAAELTIQMLRAGSDSESPFAPIIAGGPNSANPHAAPGDRKIQAGDLIVVDWGAYYMGYCSDLTRTLAVGEVEPELAHIARVVAEANTTGRAAARPGIPAGKVDQVTRAVIEQAGYGPQFRHRTGHGLGMEVHEPPYIFGENPLILEEGMTFTVEPGIYFIGRGGVRIEDNVAITQNGAETLSDLSRDLWVVG